MMPAYVRKYKRKSTRVPSTKGKGWKCVNISSTPIKKLNRRVTAATNETAQIDTSIKKIIHLGVFALCGSIDFKTEIIAD
jgi:hypothetical protein